MDNNEFIFNYQDTLNKNEKEITELNLKIQSLYSIIETKDMLINSLNEDLKKFNLKREIDNEELIKKQKMVALLNLAKTENEKQPKKDTSIVRIRRRQI